VFLGLKQAEPIKQGNLLAIADPDIEAAPMEVEAIAQLYTGRNKVLSESLATESEAKAWVGDYDIVHMSIHGVFDAAEPLFSYLKLAPGAGDDGRLTAAEIFGLPLAKARLVVLSACETGKAGITHGDEVIGLVRALLYAGAASLVLSQWEVDAESTSLWMQTFYREAQTKPLAEAGRLALLAVKSREEYHHPYYWAAFTLVTR
jgi:CHAT domain-containing protein